MELLVRFARRKAALVYPVPPAPPTAVLGPWFRSKGLVRVFPQGWSAAAAAYAPAAIAADWPQLEALLPLKIPSLTHALIVLARPEEAWVTLAQRQKAWNAFGVPVFQQVVARNGVLLAAECEAHEGLHIDSASLSAAAGSMETAVCGCGRKTPRLMSVAPADPLRALSAQAR